MPAEMRVCWVDVKEGADATEPFASARTGEGEALPLPLLLSRALRGDVDGTRIRASAAAMSDTFTCHTFSTSACHSTRSGSSGGYSVSKGY
jgi:hypothetical protein